MARVDRARVCVVWRERDGEGRVEVTEVQDEQRARLETRRREGADAARGDAGGRAHAPVVRLDLTPNDRYADLHVFISS